MKLYFREFFEKCKDETSIKKTYRGLAMIYHPDKGGSESAFKELNEEYNYQLILIQGKTAGFDMNNGETSWYDWGGFYYKDIDDETYETFTWTWTFEDKVSKKDFKSWEINQKAISKVCGEKYKIKIFIKKTLVSSFWKENYYNIEGRIEGKDKEKMIDFLWLMRELSNGYDYIGKRKK